MVQNRGVFEDSLIAHSETLVMRPISYKFGIGIDNSRRLPWSVDGHEGKDYFINVLTGGVTQNTRYHGHNILAPWRENDLYIWRGVLRDVFLFSDEGLEQLGQLCRAKFGIQVQQVSN